MTISFIAIISTPAHAPIITTPQNPTPATAPTGLYFDHVVSIMMENEGLQNICGGNPPPCSGTSNTPFEASLATNYTVASHYDSVYRPITSQPNYVAIIGASTFTCPSNCVNINAPTLIDRLQTAGLTWKGYMESMQQSTGCDSSSSQEPYNPEHNPFIPFREFVNNGVSNATLCNKIVLANPSSCGSVIDCSLINDLNNASSAPNFLWLTPNDCNNMHASSSCSSINGCTSGGSSTCIMDGDNYLKSIVPNILNSHAFTTGRSALFITFDEGQDYCPYNGSSSEDCIYASWSGPVTKNGFVSVSSHVYNHYSLTHTIEMNWNLATLTGNDAGASTMSEFFKAQVPDFGISANPTNLVAATGSKANSTITLNSINNFTGTATLTATSSPAGPTLTLTPSSVSVPKGSTVTSKLTFQTATSGNYTVTVKGVSGSLNHNTTLTVSVSSPDFTISANPSSLTFGQLTTTAGPSVAVSSTSDRTYFESSYLTPSFYAQGLIWLFYENSQFNCEHQGGCLMYTTSTNGTTWAAPTNVGVHITDSDFSVYTNGTNIFYARYNETTYDNDCGKAIRFGLGKLSPAGTVTWSPEKTVTSGASNRAYPDDNIVVDSNGQVWISYFIDSKSSCHGDGSQMPHIVHSAGTNYASWTGNVTLCVASCNSNNWHIDTVSLGNGQVYALYWLSSDGVFGRLYSGTSWGSEETLSTDPTDVNNWLFNKGTSLYAIYFDNNFESYYFATRASSGTWTSSLIGVGESRTNSFSGYYSLPDAAAYDSRDSLFDLFYMNMTTQRIDRWQGFNSTWTRKVGFVNTSAVPYADSISSFIQSSPALVGSIFYISGSSSFTLNVVNLLFTNPGNTANVTATVTGKFGFTGTVILNTYVSPSTGLSASCNPSSISGGSGTSVCTLTSSTKGNYTVTINGTSGSLSHNATVTVDVLASGNADFSVSASTPPPVNSGQSAISTVTVTALNGFAGTVTLTDTVPSGLTCGAITPGTITGSGTATVSCSSVNALNYTLTITGTSGTLNHSTNAIFRFQDFTVSATSVVSQAGTSAASTVTIASANGFGGTVLLNDTIPSGLSCSPISPSSLVGSGTATVSCNATAAGNYTLTITAKSGSLTHVATPTFRFQDFTITATSPTTRAGSAVNSTVTIQALNGFAGTISLTTVVPSGLTCSSISPNSVVGGGAATVSCSSNIAGNYTLTVKGTSASLVHNTTAIFHIQDYTISATSPPPVYAGQSATSTTTITSLNHFAGTVNLTDVVPSGLTCGPLTPTSVSGSGVVTISCHSASAGNYTVTIQGTSATLIHTANATFMFQDFAVAASSPTPLGVGQNANSTITVTALDHFSGTVSLTVTTQTGLVCGPITPTSITGSGTAGITCSASTAGNYTLTMTATSGTLSHNATATFRFQNFTIAATSPTKNVGSSVNSTITIQALNGFAGAVSLTDIVPSGLTCGSITPSSLTGSGTATVACSAAVAGNYTLTITGRSGPLAHNATAIFHIQDFTVNASTPPAIDAGLSASTTISITALNHFSGMVNLTDAVPTGLSCGAISPNSVTGSGSATVSCSATVAGNYTLTITATSGSLVHSTTAKFTFRDFTIAAVSPPAKDASQQATATIQLTAVNHFNGTITLTDTVPSGLNCGIISPASIIGSGTATVTCTASIAGNYTLTIAGTSTPLLHNATAVFMFQNFTMIASSPTAVYAGQSATSTISLSAVNHFNGTITLTDTPPSGLTCGTITPTTVAGFGTATVSCSSTIAGNYTLTITGTSGPLVHTATATFMLENFTLTSTSPGPVDTSQSATSTINVTSLNHFAGTISLSDTVPNGLTCGAITPNSLTGSGSATLSCSSTLAGNFTVTVTGTSGSLVHVATTTFMFQNFTITVTSPAAVDAGQSVTSTISLTALNHFSGNVTLTDVLPSGPTCGPISPGSMIGSGTATVSCSSTIAGNYTLTVTGTATPLAHSATISFRFQDFYLNATSPPSVLVTQPGTSTIKITSLNHFNSTITLTDSVPGGLTCGAIVPNSVTGSGTASLNCTSLTAGNFTVTVTATSSPLVHNATIVFRFQDFTVLATAVPNVVVNQSPSINLTITPKNHFSGTISLTDNIPVGLSCGSILPNSITGSGTATISCTATTAGNYTLTVTGTSGPLSHNATSILRFQDFTISTASPSPLLVQLSGVVTINVTGVNGFTGTVLLTDTVPSGINCATISPSNVNGTGTATFSCASGTVGNYTLTVTGTSGSLVRSKTVVFRIQDFQVVATPNVVSNVGTFASSTITVTGLNGFSGTVNLGDSLPTGLSCDPITPNSISGSGSATVSCNSTIAGNYTITVTGTSSSVVRSSFATFQFEDFTVSAPTVGPTLAGVPTNATLFVSALNGFGGVVQLSSSAQPGLVCGSISPGNLTSHGQGEISCFSNVAGNYTLMLNASSGSLNHAAGVVIQVQDFNMSAPSLITTRPDGSITANVTITMLNGFKGTIVFSNFPSGHDCAAVNPGLVNASATVSVNCFGVMQTFSLTVTGNSGPLIHTISITIQPNSTSVGGTFLPIDKARIFAQFLPPIAAILAFSIGTIVIVNRRRRTKRALQAKRPTPDD